MVLRRKLIDVELKCDESRKRRDERVQALKGKVEKRTEVQER